MHERLLISDKKLFVLYHTNIDKVEVFCVLHDKVSLPTRCLERGTGNRQQIIFGKVWTRYIQNIDQFLMTQIRRN